MASGPASPPPGRGGGFYKALALLLVLGAAGYALWPGNGLMGSGRDKGVEGNDKTVDGRDASAAADPAAAARAVGQLPRGVPTRDLSEVISLAPGQPEPGMAEVIERLHQEGIHEGLGAFNPPGTSPPLVGIAVPADFPLPDGYVRHHQTTDDGQDIEAILMFSPDYDFFDAAGQPVQVPANRVVPPSLAPPGLPIRQVRIPQPVAGDGGTP